MKNCLYTNLPAVKRLMEEKKELKKEEVCNYGMRKSQRIGQQINASSQQNQGSKCASRPNESGRKEAAEKYQSTAAATTIWAWSSFEQLHVMYWFRCEEHISKTQNQITPSVQLCLWTHVPWSNRSLEKTGGMCRILNLD